MWLLIFLMFLAPLYGQTVTTSDGRSVILKEDGSWAYTQTVEPGEFTFRQTYWGMNREAVKATEGSKFARDQGALTAYEGKISNLGALIVYQFASDKLVGAAYSITEQHSNKNDYIKDYSVMRNALNDKYGSPLIDENQWKNSLYADDRENFGLAVSLGHLQYWSTWETDSTKMFLLLAGDNFKISLKLNYSSTALRPMAEAEKKKESLSEF